MSNKSDQGNAKTGVVPGIIACVFAVLGIFTMGMVVVPLAVGFILLRFRILEVHKEQRYQEERASNAKRSISGAFEDR